MSLSKFERFVQSSALWFASSSSFLDPFEGTKGAAESNARDRLWDQLEVSAEQRERIRGITDWNKQWSFVNCWMMNTIESDLMWRTYAESNGVAIESTCARLRGVLPDWIFVHQVEYIDYDKDRMIGGHSLAPVFYKRKEFADEREIRAVIDVFPVTDSRRTGPLRPGNEIEVDLSKLVTRVILSPSPTPSLVNRVRDLAQSVGIPIAYSSLDKRPWR
jgi:hypothetical protein